MTEKLEKTEKTVVATKRKSQILKVLDSIRKAGESGATVAAIAKAGGVPKGNILPLISMLRKQKHEIFTVRRELNTGSRKVYFVMGQHLKADERAKAKMPPIQEAA